MHKKIEKVDWIFCAFNLWLEIFNFGNQQVRIHPVWFWEEWIPRGISRFGAEGHGYPKQSRVFAPVEFIGGLPLLLPGSQWIWTAGSKCRNSKKPNFPFYQSFGCYQTILTGRYFSQVVWGVLVNFEKFYTFLNIGDGFF